MSLNHADSGTLSLWSDLSWWGSSRLSTRRNWCLYFFVVAWVGPLTDAPWTSEAIDLLMPGFGHDLVVSVVVTSDGS